MTVMALLGRPRLDKDPCLNLQGFGNRGISREFPGRFEFACAALELGARVSTPPTPIVTDTSSSSELIVCNVGCRNSDHFLGLL